MATIAEPENPVRRFLLENNKRLTPPPGGAAYRGAGLYVFAYLI